MLILNTDLVDPKHRAGALSSELRELMESKVILLSSYVTDVLDAAKISTVEVIVSFILISSLFTFRYRTYM